MPKLFDLPHLFVHNAPAATRFTSPRAGGGKTRTAARDRQEHGEALKAQFLAAAETDDERPLRFEFESEPGFDLHLQSLDPVALGGIELLNVRFEGEATKATVLVPRRRLKKFVRVFEDYLTKTRGKNQLPANRTLVESIARIRRASVRSLWTDRGHAFPEGGGPVWWEAWLRRTEDGLERFRKHAKRRGVSTSRLPLRFVDRVVINVQATAVQLSEILEEDDLLAELRAPKISTAEFKALSAKEQREWSEDLLGRLKYAGPDAPAVCLLDTGVTRAHPLLRGSLAASDCQTIREDWGSNDTYGHGSQMAGLALFGDLGPVLASQDPVVLSHILESVKLVPEPGAVHEPESFGAVTREGIARAEIAAPNRARLSCLTITSGEGLERGRPSSWSAALDDAAFGEGDATRRLICVSGGNASLDAFVHYPTSNLSNSIEDPGQAWNALTVGAFADRDLITEPDLQTWKPIAPRDDLCPSSTTSVTWDDRWPIKPEVVLEGGNAALNDLGVPDFTDSLCLLSTHHQPIVGHFQTTGETSAATALAARLGARIQARYPKLWPEAVRALIIHSAEWTQAMKGWLPKTKTGKSKAPTRREIRQLLRTFGYGVPDALRALASASDSLTLIKQARLQPFARQGSRFVTNEMHLYELPWPVAELKALGSVSVELRVTLSYFIQPLPSERGFEQNQRHRYASHGLRFDLKTGAETPELFSKRINKAMRSEGEGAATRGDAEKWTLGPDLRSGGSLHSDVWIGPAVELAAKNCVAVYPVVGWWRERPRFERWNSDARYALVVSIRAPGVETDIYTPVAVKLGVRVPVTT